MCTINRRSPLFEKQVPIALCRHGEREEPRCLMVRIFNGLKGASSELKEYVLYLEITDDSNLFFLYNIAIDNTLFETIRMEQNFQIPLDQLADHLIEPLERCVDQMESFEARLVLLEEEAQAKLKIIQKTATKEVEFLYLLFRKGNDDRIKDYLASRLHFTLTLFDEAVHEIQDLQEDRDRQEASLRVLSDEHERLHREIQTSSSQLTLSHEQEHRALQEEHARVLDVLEKNHRDALFEIRQEQACLVSKQQEEREEWLKEKMERKEEMGELRKERDLLEEQVDRLGRKEQALLAEVEILTQERRELTVLNDQYQREVQQLTADLHATQEALRVAKDTSTNASQLQQEVVRSRDVLESQCEALREERDQLREQMENARKQHNAVEEEKMQGDRKTLKLETKLRKMKEILVAQEKEVQQHQLSFAQLSNQYQLELQAKEHKEQQHTFLEGRITQLEAQLRESKGIIERNEQVIAYLNKSLDERWVSTKRNGKENAHTPFSTTPRTPTHTLRTPNTPSTTSPSYKPPAYGATQTPFGERPREFKHTPPLFDRKQQEDDQQEEQEEQEITFKPSFKLHETEHADGGSFPSERRELLRPSSRSVSTIDKSSWKQPFSPLHTTTSGTTSTYPTTTTSTSTTTPFQALFEESSSSSSSSRHSQLQARSSSLLALLESSSTEEGDKEDEDEDDLSLSFDSPLHPRPPPSSSSSSSFSQLSTQTSDVRSAYFKNPSFPLATHKLT